MHSSAILLGLLAGVQALIASPFANSVSSRSLGKRLASSTFPSAAGTSSVSKPIEVSGVFDGKMYRYDRGTSYGGQSEGGDADAVFLVSSGGTVRNVIIGSKQSEGIHCLGPCTIQNVWWEDVCEDALTIKQTSGTSYVIGGGARGAEDKVLQHNGGGTLSISNFYVQDFAKLYRSCGNCKTQYKRTVIIDGVLADTGKSLVGINSNYGDTARITNSCLKGVKDVCNEYTGNNNGAEPIKKSSGPSNACIYTTTDVSKC